MLATTSTQLTIVMENTGTEDAYYVDLAITLPPGITYNTFTAESGLGSDTDSATAAAISGGIIPKNPAISGSTITFYDLNDKGSNLAPVIQAVGGTDDTLALRFTVQSACYITGNLDFDLRYYDSLDVTQYSTTTSQTLTGLFPSLTVTKTPVNSQVDCAAQQSWIITVTNNGIGQAEVVRIEDTLGDWIDVNLGASTGGLTPMPLISPQTYGWEINNLAGGGGTAGFTLVGTLNPDAPQADCTAALRQNNVQAIWACGINAESTDNDPTTQGYACEDSTVAEAPPAALQMPNLVVTSITPVVSCASDGSFSGTISVRVTNNGDGATSGTFTVEVTDGKGWTGTGTYGPAIASGGPADVTIPTFTWPPDCQPCGAPYSFNATVDLNDDICECNETDNTIGSPTTP